MVAKALVNVIVILVIIVAFVYGLSFLQTVSYASLTQKYVEFESLLARPDFYNNKQVCTVGTYSEGFEMSTLNALRSKNSQAIWISAPVEKNLMGNLKELYSNYIDTDKAFTQSTAKVCGTFQFRTKNSNGFGQLGNYLYQITQ